MTPLKIGGIYVRRCGCIARAIERGDSTTMRLKRMKSCGEQGHSAGHFGARISDGKYVDFLGETYERDYRDVVREIEP